MSWLGKALLFALKEVASPTLDELGKKVGSAIGERLGRRVDPEGARLAAEAKKTPGTTASGDDDDGIDEDERTP